MLLFPNAKINIGLKVLGKRPDGYHDIFSVFYPIPLTDVLEFVEGSGTDRYHYSGFAIPGDPSDNLCAKALAALRVKSDIPPLEVYLHKAIPMGAGLGGGSSDAAFFVKGLNAAFNLGLDSTALKEIAAQIGSDCAFFIDNEPALAEGRGELLSPVALDLSGKYIAVVGPGKHISTAEAYKHVHLGGSAIDLSEYLENNPVSDWGSKVDNAFEKYAIATHPEIGAIKEKLCDAGAAYASMTGSGSAVFGLFDQAPSPAEFNAFKGYFTFSAKL